MPWDEYWDALETLQLAHRHADEVCVAHAKLEAEGARDRCRWLGSFLLLLALEQPEVIKALRRLTDELPVMVSQEATRAHSLARSAMDEVDALRKRHRGIERENMSLEARVEALELLLEGRCACRSRVAEESQSRGQGH